LGGWKKGSVIRLKWTDGHIWTNEQPIYLSYSPLKANYFTYKYVKLDKNHNFVNFEEGIDRIADLDLLKDDPTIPMSYQESTQNGPN
jgi:hypothetical protein